MKGTIIGQQVFQVDALRPHERNGYFFDDMDGEKWREFLDSVAKHGVINPPVVTEDGRIISGHQRVRACRELGIPGISCTVERFQDKTAEEVALIESNIRQRGVINSPNVKLGRILKVLEDAQGAGVGQPSGRYKLARERRKEIYCQLNIDRKTACRARGMARMPDSLQEMTIAGKLDATTAYEDIIKLTDEEQAKLARQLMDGDTYARKEIRAIIGALPDAERLREIEARIMEAHRMQEETELDLRQKLQETQRRERNTYEALQAEKKAHRKTERNYEKKMELQERYMLDYLRQTDTEIVVGACQALCRALYTISDREDTIEGGGAYDAVNEAMQALENVRKRIALPEGETA